MEREKLGSRLGFILLSAGCAIGIGNVCKFPYMAGQYGGGGFVLIYVCCLLLLGLPVMIMEPLRGGRLVNNLPEKAKKLFENYDIKIVFICRIFSV